MTREARGINLFGFDTPLFMVHDLCQKLDYSGVPPTGSMSVTNHGIGTDPECTRCQEYNERRKAEIDAVIKRATAEVREEERRQLIVEGVQELKDSAKREIGKFERIGSEMGALVEEKNAAYGSAFEKCGDFLNIIYPNGVQPEQFVDMLCIVRIFDKLMRIANDAAAFGESPYRDIGGYSILGTELNERNKDLPV